MSSNDAVRFVSRQFKKGLSAARVAENLVDLAVKRYTTDNVAAVVIHLQEEQPSPLAKPRTVSNTSSWK